MFNQCTDEPGLIAHLDQPRRVYCGFDPTADSLTIGNLVPIMALKAFVRHGHEPVVVLGGATGRIGDPSGKDNERKLLDDAQIGLNIAGQRRIFERLLGREVALVDNDEWFRSMSAYTFLRDVGKHFSVNQMIARDSVRNRLEREGQGISYTEFSYMLLQAYDFLHLYRDRGVTLQFAGADQWGNTVSGVDLVRRLHGQGPQGEPLAFGLTAPLVTRADGGKFGKSEAGAVWLTHERQSGQPGTSPYAYYQFWLNVSDEDVRRYLSIFTELPLATIDELTAAHAAAPHERIAQRALAEHATSLLHGAEALQRAQAAATALFSGAVRELDAQTLAEAFADVPSSEHDRAQLGGDGIALVDVLAQTSLAKSKGEARKHLDAGAVCVNGDKVSALDARLTTGDLLGDAVVLLRRGKKAWHVTRWR
jgi:tyrosyl-tRNA synthetase